MSTIARKRIVDIQVVSAKTRLDEHSLSEFSAASFESLALAPNAAQEVAVSSRRAPCHFKQHARHAAWLGCPRGSADAGLKTKGI